MNLSLLALVVVATPASKLGPVILTNPFDLGAAELLNHCPAVAVYVAPLPGLNEAIVALRNACPKTKTRIAVRVAVSAKFALAAAPETAADNFWGAVYANLYGVAPANIDWLEGPHGFDNIPDWSRDPQAATWVAAFWSRLADRMHESQFNPLVGSIPSGTPALDGELSAASINLFKPIADAMKAKTYRWGWSYHAYSPTLTAQAASEAASSLRYRAIHDQCDLGAIPLVLTEAGQGPSKGWKEAGTSSASYLAWLKWLDDQLQLDSYVQGAALFQFGDLGTYSGFELSRLAVELGRWIQSPSIPDAGLDGGSTGDRGADGGGDGGPSGGSSGGSITPSQVSGHELPGRGDGCSSAGSAAIPAAALAALFLRPRRRRFEPRRGPRTR